MLQGWKGPNCPTRESKEREEVRSVKRSEVKWKTGVFVFGQLSLHAADIYDYNENWTFYERNKPTVCLFFMNDSGTLWHFIKHCSSASCGMPKNKAHNFFSFFTLCWTLFCRAKKTKYINTPNPHAHSTLRRHAIEHRNLEYESQSRCTNTQKEASAIKASVGPAEQRPSCLTGITVFSSVTITAWYPLGTRVAWPRLWAYREDNQCCHVLLLFVFTVGPSNTL